MKIAVIGCAHGEIGAIYDTVKSIEVEQKIKIDLVICCGDFQATRNEADLRCMAVPVKYYNMGTFYKYYSQEETVPVLTIFIGGNHEASNYLQELEYGGWVAPNIYYMGYAGVVTIGGIRIGGISGIYKGHDYMRGHFEKSPYSDGTKRSVYHVRNCEVFQLKQLKEPLDIMISHDWPRGVYKFGCVEELLKKKPFFRNDINEDKLGSHPCEELLFHLKPKYWFSAHLHTKFAALIPHSVNNNKRQYTKFLALDKCLPGRDFLQIIDIPHKNEDMRLNYDLEWLTILYLTNHLISSKHHIQYMPTSTWNERWTFTPTDEEKQKVLNKFDNNLQIPLNFIQTAPIYEKRNNSSFHSKSFSDSITQPDAKLNPQTSFLCNTLGIKNRLHSLLNDDALSSSTVSYVDEVSLCSNISSFINDTVEIDNSQSCSDGDESPSNIPDEQKEVIIKDEKNSASVVGNSNVSGFDEFFDAFNEESDAGNDNNIPSNNSSFEQSSSKRNRNQLSLPSPKYHSDNSSIASCTNSSQSKLELTSSTHSSLVLPYDRTFSELEDSNKDDSIDGNVPKKFKRRNQLIYDNDDDS